MLRLLPSQTQRPQLNESTLAIENWDSDYHLQSGVGFFKPLQMLEYQHNDCDADAPLTFLLIVAECLPQNAVFGIMPLASLSCRVNAVLIPTPYVLKVAQHFDPQRICYLRVANAPVSTTICRGFDLPSIHASEGELMFSQRSFCMSKLSEASRRLISFELGFSIPVTDVRPSANTSTTQTSPRSLEKND